MMGYSKLPGIDSDTNIPVINLNGREDICSSSEENVFDEESRMVTAADSGS